MTQALSLFRPLLPRLALALSLGLLLAGCAGGGPIERWQMTEDRTPELTAPAGQAGASRPVQVVFFRQAPAGGQAQRPINLYINGHYQASLVGSTYTEQSLCPGPHRMAVHLNDVQRRYVTKTEGQAIAIAADKPIQYFRVAEDGAGQASLHPATSSEASAATSLKLLQTHTIARVPKSHCAARS